MGNIYTTTAVDKEQKAVNYQDFCKSITTQIFDIIDKKGSLLTWQKEWDSTGCKKLPIGAKGRYHGSNLFSLLCAQWTQGYQFNEWLTFLQVQKQNGKIKKGAKSETVFFWQIKEVEEEKNGEKTLKKIPIFKTYNVFNLEQTTLPAPAVTSPATQASSSTVENLINTLGVTISHFGNKAYYDGNDDIIILPDPSRFTSKENYAATLLHELVHWGAGQNRSPRACFKEYHHDIKARAEEELVAEIGSAFLAVHYAIKGELENHASYIQSWKSELTATQIMRAANEAAKAFEWIIHQQ